MDATSDNTMSSSDWPSNIGIVVIGWSSKPRRRDRFFLPLHFLLPVGREFPSRPGSAEADAEPLFEVLGKPREVLDMK